MKMTGYHRETSTPDLVSPQYEVAVVRGFCASRPDPPRGMGVGPFIVKCAADLLQHRIEVDSTPGHGSCFAVVAKAANAAAHRIA